MTGITKSDINYRDQNRSLKLSVSNLNIAFGPFVTGITAAIVVVICEIFSPKVQILIEHFKRIDFVNY
jgi:hypothetical protein